MPVFPDLLAAHSTSDRPFLTDEVSTTTFADIQRRVSELAGRLSIRAGDVVAVAPGNDVDSVLRCLAVWRAGGVVQLVNRRLTEPEARAQTEKAGAVRRLGDGLEIAEVDSKPGLPIELRSHDPEETALIVATSGTGGRARLVELSWGNLMASAESSRSHLRQVPGDRWLAVLPLFHVGGFSIIVRSLLAGSEVVLRKRFDLVQTAADLHAVTLASLVGSMLLPILGVDPGPFSTPRAVLVGGGPTPASVLRRAADAGIPVLSTYGMTETASQIATSPLGDGPNRRALPVPGAEIRIGDAGEIEVRGPMVSKSYVGEPSHLSDGWLATGDVGSIDGEGYLRIAGRLSDVVITGGENVMPAEVEAAIRDVIGIDDVFVVGVQDDEWGEALVAVVVTGVAVATIERDLRDRLAGYKIPRRWVVVDEIPRNELGKVDRGLILGEVAQRGR